MDNLKDEFEKLYNAGNTEKSKLIELLFNMFPTFSRAEIEAKVSQWLSEEEKKKKSKLVRKKARFDVTVSYPLSCSEEAEERQL